MSDDDVTPDEKRRLDEGRTRRYIELSRFRDRDALQDAFVRDPKLWDKDIPIVVAAARFRAVDERRRAARRAAIEADAPPAGPQAPASAWDPLDVVLAREEMGELLAALAALDQPDLLVVWLSAVGYTDHEIAASWDKLSPEPRPSLDAIRQRRSRAVRRLRDRLKLPDD